MALERIVLNIIPAGEMPVFHCSQYENGRPVIIDLVSSDDDAYLVPEGASVELHCRKVDDNIVTLEPDEVDNNTVTFVSTEQLTACPGDNLCEIVLYADTDPVQTIATLNFILHVEPDPLEGGLTSETQIYNLTQQVEEITQQVIGDDYYNKTEVDSLLAGKADQATTYTKSEVDTALNLKADKATTYTKSQVDSALALKADVSNVYTKSQTDTLLNAKANTADLATVATTGDYDDLTNKPDIEDMIADALFAVMPVGSVGPSAIANFETELAAPLQSVIVDVVATQGPGTPTPSNPLPISGYTEANITANGDMVTIAFGQTVYGGVLDVTRGKLTVTHAKYTGTWGDGRSEYLPPQAPSVKRRTFTLNPQAPTSSVPNNGHSLCSVTDEYSTNNNLDSSHYYVADNLYVYLPIATSDNTAIECSYVIKEPFDIDLTPEVISAIVGENNVYSDTGNTTVQYKDSIQHYIDQRT